MSIQTKCYDLVFSSFRLPDDSLPFFDSACESSGCSLDSLKGWLCLQLVPWDTFPKPICLAFFCCIKVKSTAIRHMNEQAITCKGTISKYVYIYTYIIGYIYIHYVYHIENLEQWKIHTWKHKPLTIYWNMLRWKWYKWCNECSNPKFDWISALWRIFCKSCLMLNSFLRHGALDWRSIHLLTSRWVCLKKSNESFRLLSDYCMQLGMYYLALHHFD